MGRSPFRALVANRRAVFARFAGTVKGAVLPVDENALITAVGAGAGGLDDVVAFGAELLDGLAADAALDVERATAIGGQAGGCGTAGVHGAGLVAGGLDVHAE